MRYTMLAAMFATLAVQPAMAQPPGPPIDIVQELGLSGEQAKKVEAIRQQTRERMRALREQERAELAKVLSPQQLAKLDSIAPKPPGVGGQGQQGPQGSQGQYSGGGQQNQPPRRP